MHNSKDQQQTEKRGKYYSFSTFDMKMQHGDDKMFFESAALLSVVNLCSRSFMVLSGTAYRFNVYIIAYIRVLPDS